MDISVSGPIFQQISSVADWNISRKPSYFSSEKRYDADIFYDLLEPQHYGFILDQRYVTEDVLAGMRTCLPLDITIAGEYFTLRTLKPYGTEKTAYRTVTLKHGERYKTITYFEEEPDYLMYEILRFAGYAGKVFVNIAEPDEGAYWFILIPARITPEQLHPLSFTLPAKASAALTLANTTHPAPQEYLYTPLITSNLVEPPNAITSSHVDVLISTKQTKTDPPISLSVKQGRTLDETVRDDLRKNFKYTSPFKILDFQLLSDTDDKQPHILVHVSTEQFDTANWQTVPTIDIYRKHKLGFGLHTRMIE